MSTSPHKKDETIKSPQKNTAGSDHEVRMSPQNDESNATKYDILTSIF